jgi:hypothetical protein
MPVCTLIRPMLYNEGGGCLRRYGIGQYWFGSEAWSSFVTSIAATASRKTMTCTDPGPPATLIGLAGESLANTWPRV